MTQSIPDSRSYVHSRCGETTEADGGDFRNLAAPVPGMIKTICANCGRPFPVEEFQWSDTKERIDVYYQRLQSRVPSTVRLLCSRRTSTLVVLLGFLSGIAIGIASGMAMGKLWGLLIAVAGSLVGAIAALVVWDAFTTRILSRSLGVPDVRCLR